MLIYHVLALGNQALGQPKLPPLKTNSSGLQNLPVEELYDLESDPWEFNNLAGVLEYAGVQEQLGRQLRHWQESTGMSY